MCTVSVINEYGRNIPNESWNRSMLDNFRKLLEEAKHFDIVTNQPGCEDPEKTTWIEAVETKVASEDSQ